MPHLRRARHPNVLSAKCERGTRIRRPADTVCFRPAGGGASDVPTDDGRCNETYEHLASQSMNRTKPSAARPAIAVLRDEPDWVAVAKPAGLATIPGRGEEDSVLERLADQLGMPCRGAEDPRLRVVHRLDK